MDISLTNLLEGAENAQPGPLSGDPRGLQFVSAPDTNKGHSPQVCVTCRRSKAVSEFYRKRDSYERRCRSCVLATKAKAYRAKCARLRIKRKAQQEVVWHEVFESAAKDDSSPVNLDALLRDFMLDVILDAS